MTAEIRDNKLLDSVDALTKPDRTKIIQDGPVGSGLAGQHTVIVELPPLLEQLHQAINGTIGIGGSGSLPWQRNMLDADALFRFMKINSHVKEWAHMVNARITPDDPVSTLRAWYVLYAAKSADEKREAFYIRQMNGWASQIKAKLNPARLRDLPDPCPECEATTWFNPADKMEYLRPLIVTYHQTGANLIQEAVASCRACGYEWGVRELAYALEKAEAKREQEQHADVELTNYTGVVHT